MAFSVYSLADVVLTFSHPDVGQCVLSDGGAGRISITYAGDLASNTRTATGYVVVNKLVSRDGTIGVEVPNNSDADVFLRKFIKYIKGAATSRFALGTMTLVDPAANRTLNMVGVVPQKAPDEGYDQTAGNRQYNLLCAEIVEV